MCCSHALDTSITISYLHTRISHSSTAPTSHSKQHSAPQVQECLVAFLGTLLLLLVEVFNSAACVQLLRHLSAALSGHLLKPE